MRDGLLWSINGSEYFVTSEHPFMTTQWWKSFDPDLTKEWVNLEVWKLKVWDILITEKWYKLIKSLSSVNADEDTQLYNLMLNGDHTYYADGYLVHNKVDTMIACDGKVACNKEKSRLN